MGSVAMTNNPCFNVYDISDHCPFLWGVLGSIGRGSDTSAGDTTYFNRPGVKTAMHALEVDWMICAGKAVFIAGDAGPESEGDLSADPIQRVLPQVIEATNRVFIGNGDLDMILVTNGTLMSIQNMTWNGKLGFQQQPSTPIEITLPKLQYGSALDDASGKGVDTAQGVMGIQHFERGLLWAETYLSGHMQPQYQPRVSYGHLEWLLGRVEKI
jgi:carboxypeptidase D